MHFASDSKQVHNRTENKIKLENVNSNKTYLFHRVNKYKTTTFILDIHVSCKQIFVNIDKILSLKLLHLLYENTYGLTRKSD